MTLHESEIDARIFTGLGQAIRSVSPVNPSGDGAFSDARFEAAITVYRNNVRSAFLRALQDIFPVIHRLVGEKFFRYLAHEYYHAHAPSSPLVSRYGDALPVFLRSFEPVSGLAYLPDIARLELAWLSAYHAAEADCMAPERVIAALRENPQTILFELHPSARLISSPYPVHAIWIHNKNLNAGKPQLPAGGECVLVCRPHAEVFTETIPRPFWTALKALQEGKPLGVAISAATQDGDVDGAADINHRIATSKIIKAVAQTA